MKTPEEHHRENHGSWAMAECHRCKCALTKCRGKITYPDVLTARQTARDVNTARGWSEPVKHYPCIYCLGYHLGRVTRSGDLRRAERERRKVLRGRALEARP